MIAECGNCRKKFEIHCDGDISGYRCPSCGGALLSGETNPGGRVMKRLSVLLAVLGLAVLLLTGAVLLLLREHSRNAAMIEEMSRKIRDLDSRGSGFAAMNSDNEARIRDLEKRFERFYVPLAALTATGENAPVFLTDRELRELREEIASNKKNADAIRSWQSKYSGPLEYFISGADRQAVSESFDEMVSRLEGVIAYTDRNNAALAADVGALSEQLAARLGNVEATVNVLCNYCNEVGITINDIIESNDKVQDDLATLYKRVNWLNQRDNTRVIFVRERPPKKVRPMPPPPGGK